MRRRISDVCRFQEKLSQAGSQATPFFGLVILVTDARSAEPIGKHSWAESLFD